MFRLWIENEKSQKEELTNSPYYESVSIEGLLPPKAEFSSTRLVNMDGEKEDNARVGARDITITIKPSFPVEENRQRLYTYLKSKKYVKIYFQNENRDITTIGKVESFDGSLFEMKQTLIINIRCFDPYLQDRYEMNINMSNVIDLFEFPFAIEEDGIEFSRLDKSLTQNIFNDGDVETGLIIEISANGEVVNPVIYNADTREYFGLKITMQLGDLIRINTNKNSKYVELVRYGETRNIMNSIIKGNKWFQVQPGDNLFTYTCESGEEYINFKFIYSNKYEGV